MGVDAKPLEVSSEVLVGFNPDLTVTFVDDLKDRQDNLFGPDLGY